MAHTIIRSIRRAVRQPHVQGYTLAIVAGLLLVYAGWGFWQRYHATNNPHPLPPGSTVVTASTDQPDETKIDLSANYRVAADQPRLIDLPTIKAKGFIQKVGIDQNQAIAVPTNVHLAGWYVAGSRPGDDGVALIDGHVQGVYQPGIFERLDELAKGDRFSIQFGDLSIRHFEVVSVRSYDVDVAAERMFQPQPGLAGQLDLITCGGDYDKNAKAYRERILVISKVI